MEYNKRIDEEYLLKPQLNVTYIITDEMIKINTENTGFINCSRVHKLVQTDILELYKEIVRMAKENAIIISHKNKMRKYVTENWQIYLDSVKAYNALFEILNEKAKELQKRGIHFGCADDYFLDDCLKIENEMSTFFYTNSPISKMNHIYNYFKELYDGLKRTPNRYFKIYL